MTKEDLEKAIFSATMPVCPVGQCGIAFVESTRYPIGLTTHSTDISMRTINSGRNDATVY
jgi:hypothetical protein